MTDTFRIICWNIARSREAIDRLPDFNADIALLQEVYAHDWEHLRSYSHWDQYLPTLPSRPWLRWPDDYGWPAWPAVVQLTGRNYIRSLTHVGPETIPRADDLPSRTAGLTAGARIIPGQGRQHFTLISAYARYLADPEAADGLSPRNANREIQLDVTEYAHFECAQRPVIVAGDFNCEILPANPKPWEIPNLFTTYPQGGFHYFGPDHLAESPNANVDQVGANQTESIQPIDANRQHGHVFATPHFDGLLSAVVIPDDDLPGNHHPILIEVQV